MPLTQAATLPGNQRIDQGKESYRLARIKIVVQVRQVVAKTLLQYGSVMLVIGFIGCGHAHQARFQVSMGMAKGYQFRIGLLSARRDGQEGAMPVIPVQYGSHGRQTSPPANRVRPR